MMSPEDKRLLERNLPSLVTRVALEDGLLLAHLRARGAINRLSEETVQSVEGRPDQARRLLDILLKGDCDVIDKFVYSLRATVQGHIADEYLRQPRKLDKWNQVVYTENSGGSSGNVLSKTDVELLEEARPQMMEHLGLSDGRLLSQLRVRGVLEDFEEDQIKAEKGDSNGVGRLINLILQKNSDSMEDFLHALTQTGHYYLVKRYLRPSTMSDTFVPEKIGKWEMADMASVVSRMSPEDQNMLEECRVSLVTHIAIEDGMLLAHLRARGALTARLEEDVKIAGDRPRQVERLLDTLLKGDCDSFDKFVYSLRAAEQGHVADQYLRPPRRHDNWNPAVNTVQTADVNLLERVRPQLMHEVSLKDGQLLEQLRGRGVLTQFCAHQIMGERGDSNKIGRLVDLIPKTGPDSMESFLHALNQTNHSDVVTKYLREPTTVDTFVPETPMEADDLADALRYNLGERIKEWRTALEEGVLDRGGQLAYIAQPCVETTTCSQQLDIPEAIQLVEDSSPGERFVISGAAGMGKTTLLKEIARSWIEKTNSRLVDTFKFVFLMPMRLVGKSSLLGIICDELKLLSVRNMDDLQKSLEENERKILFLLDSHEELRGDIKAKSTEIDGLITGKLFSKSTVVVTSRPGLKLSTSRHRRNAKLSDLPAEKVKEVVEQHLDEDKKAFDEAIYGFPAMSFLQKPINLAMFLFIFRRGMRDAFTYSPTELFSLVIQYIILAYAKKKQQKEFTPKPGSPFENKDVPRTIRRLLKDITRKCYEERKENSVILHLEGGKTLEEYLNFGLFAPGPEPGTAVLPHPLFQDYFAATFLAENTEAWRVLNEEIGERSEGESLIPSLIDVAESFGLGNVFEFLNDLPLSSEVCEQISCRFVAKHPKILKRSCECYQPLSSEYHSQLVLNCIDEAGKRAIAKALLSEAVVGEAGDTDSDFRNRTFVLPYVNNNPGAFLKKQYDLQLCLEDGNAMLLGSELFIDNFLIAFVYWLDCDFKAHKVQIHGKQESRLRLPACMLAQKITSVRQLSLSECEIISCEPNKCSVSDLDISATSEHLAQSSTNCLLEKVKLHEVAGLEHCGVITTHGCFLEKSGDVEISTLKTCFPNLTELDLFSRPGWSSTFLLFDTDEELSFWIPNVKVQELKWLPWGPSMEPKLRLAPQRKGKLQRLYQLLNILAGKEDISHLILSNCSLLNTRLEPTCDIVKRNSSLRHLELFDCVGEVDLCQLLDDCSQCFRLEELTVDRCELSPNARCPRDNVTQNHTLSRVKLNDCKGHVDLSRLMDFCRQCLHLEEVTVEKCELKVKAIDSEATVKENNALKILELSQCKEEINLLQFLDICNQCRQLEKINVGYSKFFLDKDPDDIPANPVTYLPSLRRLILSKSPIHRTNGEKLKRIKKLFENVCPRSGVLNFDW